jgi:hypothetical protein
MVAEHPWELAMRLLKGTDTLWHGGADSGEGGGGGDVQGEGQEKGGRLAKPGEEVMRDLTWHLCKESYVLSLMLVKR